MARGVAFVTGSTGLVGSETVGFFAEKGFDVVGVDNDMRARFFGKEASTSWVRGLLEEKYGKRYIHHSLDVRDYESIRKLLRQYRPDIIVHTAAQPSHDWAAKDPITDFTVNALATIYMLEAFRREVEDAVFVFTSTNKVYGDNPNKLPLIELESRWELPEDHPYYNGIDESMSIDKTMHSIFGASKTAADVMVQEYGIYFGLKTVAFRIGCITGPTHSGTKLHGFLSYLIRKAITGQTYTIFGYKGKQVRDNIHAWDLANAFYHYFLNPRPGEVYNMGGARERSVSILEAIDLIEKLTGKRVNYTYDPKNRKGDHMWWISSVKKFKEHYPDWDFTRSIEDIILEIYDLQSRLPLEEIMET